MIETFNLVVNHQRSLFWGTKPVHYSPLNIILLFNMLKHAIPLKELYNVRAESFLQNTGNQRF